MSSTSDLGQRVREHATDLTEQAKATAQAEARARAEDVQHTAASKVSQAASAADAASQKFDPASPQAQAIDQVAGHIDSVAAQIRTADVGEVARQATDIARRHPLLFIGGAAIVGFAAARFLKASDPDTGQIAHDPWAPRTQTRGL